MKHYMLIILFIFSLISKSYCTILYFYTEKPIVSERKSTSTTSTKSEKSVQSERIILEYGKGKFWDGLKSGKEDQKLINLKRKAKCDIRSDGNYFYKFDPAHKTTKVHLHKYKHQGGDKYKLIAEVNPETGEVKLINGDYEIW